MKRENAKAKFNDLIRRRQKLEPIAYLTNSKEFYGLDFYVDKRVLIPRPDTEVVVDQILRYDFSLKNHSGSLKIFLLPLSPYLSFK